MSDDLQDFYESYLNEPPNIFITAWINMIRQETIEIEMLIDLLSKPRLPEQGVIGLKVEDGLEKCQIIFEHLAWAHRYVRKLEGRE